MVHTDGVTYVAVIADIVASRTIPNRSHYQTGLARLLDHVNHDSNGSIISPYTITLGDEFQAVYRNPDSLFRDILRIIAHSRPWGIRFALSLGELSTPINTAQSIGMDGPAFQEARELMGRLKDRDRTIVQLVPTEPTALRLANLVLAAICHLTDTWNDNAVDVFAHLLAGRAPADIAKAVGISAGTTYKHIREKNLGEYVDALHYLTDVVAATMREAA